MVHIMNHKSLDGLTKALCHYCINEAKLAYETKDPHSHGYYTMLVAMNRYLFNQGYNTEDIEVRIIREIVPYVKLIK